MSVFPRLGDQKCVGKQFFFQTTLSNVTYVQICGSVRFVALSDGSHSY